MATAALRRLSAVGRMRRSAALCYWRHRRARWRSSRRRCHQPLPKHPSSEHHHSDLCPLMLGTAVAAYLYVDSRRGAGRAAPRNPMPLVSARRFAESVDWLWRTSSASRSSGGRHEWKRNLLRPPRHSDGFFPASRSELIGSFPRAKASRADIWGATFLTRRCCPTGGWR